MVTEPRASAILILVGAIALVLVILALAMATRSVIRDDISSDAMEKIWAMLLAVVSAVLGFLFGQNVG